MSAILTTITVVASEPPASASVPIRVRSTKANTSAIGTIQMAQAEALTKQQAFIADLQRVREMAESTNQKTAQLLASPGKDPKKGGRQ